LSELIEDILLVEVGAEDGVPSKQLDLYRQILHQGEVVAPNSSEERELLLSGLVVKQQGVSQSQ
jgi:hypothetical protein